MLVMSILFVYKYHVLYVACSKCSCKPTIFNSNLDRNNASGKMIYICYVLLHYTPIFAMYLILLFIVRLLYRYTKLYIYKYKICNLQYNHILLILRWCAECLIWNIIFEILSPVTYLMDNIRFWAKTLKQN